LILLPKLPVWRKPKHTRPLTPEKSIKNHTTSYHYRHDSPQHEVRRVFKHFPIFLTSQLPDFHLFLRPTHDFMLPGLFEAAGPFSTVLEKIINDIDQVTDIHFRGRPRPFASSQQATPKELR